MLCCVNHIFICEMFVGKIFKSTIIDAKHVTTVWLLSIRYSLALKNTRIKVNWCAFLLLQFFTKGNFLHAENHKINIGKYILHF